MTSDDIALWEIYKFLHDAIVDTCNVLEFLDASKEFAKKLQEKHDAAHLETTGLYHVLVGTKKEGDDLLYWLNQYPRLDLPGDDSISEWLKTYTEEHNPKLHKSFMTVLDMVLKGPK